MKTNTGNTYVGVVIADIHAGAFGGAILYNELNKCFIKHIEKMKLLDFIVIAGDLFDSKISLNSAHTKYIFKFLKELIEICKERNIKLRIIKGTESHDNQQLDSIERLIDDRCDMKIISTVTVEYLFDDFKCLYIPEEYMKDPMEYYKPFFENTVYDNNMYDMIFGHGMVDDVSFVAKNQQSEITMAKAPIFKTAKLIEISKGPIFFGHIHKAQNIKDHMYYTGSFSRWCFGETEPKGFMTVAYNTDNSAYDVEFIENTYAQTYDTMIVDYNSDFYKDDPNQQLEYLISVVKTATSTHLRVIFNIPDDYPKPSLLINMINDIFNNLSGIKIVINNNAKETQRKKEIEEKTKQLLNMYDFLFDKGITPEDKISRYINIKYNKNIPIEKMRDILYQKLSIDIEESD